MSRRPSRSAATAAPPAKRRDRLRRIGQPSRGRVRRRLDHDLHSVFRAQTAGDHVELQRADDADDRLAAAAGGEEHLHQPLFLELLQSLVELLVALILEADAAEMLRRKPRQRRGSATGAPEWSVSPIANWPGLTRPTTSPA